MFLSMNIYTESVGTAAALLTTISFLPQVYKIYKTKNTEGISLTMYSVFVIGIICWLVYGILLNELPIILANSITLILSGYIWVMKVRG